MWKVISEMRVPGEGVHVVEYFWNQFLPWETPVQFHFPPNIRIPISKSDCMPLAVGFCSIWVYASRSWSAGQLMAKATLCWAFCLKRHMSFHPGGIFPAWALRGRGLSHRNINVLLSNSCWIQWDFHGRISDRAMSMCCLTKFSVVRSKSSPQCFFALSCLACSVLSRVSLCAFEHFTLWEGRWLKLQLLLDGWTGSGSKMHMGDKFLFYFLLRHYLLSSPRILPYA